MTCLLALCLAASTFTTVDGDTLRAGDLRIRVWGVDAPEMHTTAGPPAKAAMQRLTAGHGLACDPHGHDKYGRTVALCELTDGPQQGQDIACLMVAGGFAVDWPKYSKGFYAGCGK